MNYGDTKKMVDQKVRQAKLENERRASFTETSSNSFMHFYLEKFPHESPSTLQNIQGLSNKSILLAGTEVHPLDKSDLGEKFVYGEKVKTYGLLDIEKDIGFELCTTILAPPNIWGRPQPAEIKHSLSIIENFSAEIEEKDLRTPYSGYVFTEKSDLSYEAFKLVEYLKEKTDIFSEKSEKPLLLLIDDYNRCYHEFNTGDFQYGECSISVIEYVKDALIKSSENTLIHCDDGRIVFIGDAEIMKSLQENFLGEEQNGMWISNRMIPKIEIEYLVLGEVLNTHISEGREGPAQIIVT